MTKLRNSTRWARSLVLVAAAVLAVAPAASAKPVSRATARHAIQADHWYDGTAQNHVLWCQPEHYGTLCRVESGPTCYRDQVFGMSEITDTDNWWVSRTHGVLSDEPVGHNTLNIWAIPPGESCDVGQSPH